MRVKKTPLLFSILCSFTFFLRAADQQASAVAIVSSDTAIVNDSLQQNLSANDPRKAFKDLFITSTEKTENYSVQLNPRAISFVQDYMGHHTKRLEQMKGWGKPYFDMMDGILVARGLPGELKYLAVVESNLKSSAFSWAGAVGPWQFMPGTAKKMGLKVNQYRDERTDYYKSTTAAARYLKELFSIYGDWLLVIAAYNGGVGNVNSAIRRSHSRNFWDLQYYLPTESRNHVKKFIATHYIMEGDGGITTVTKAEAHNAMLFPAPGKNALSQEELTNSKMMSISGKYNSVIITKNILMDITSFNHYNPDFDKQISVKGSFDLRLPGDKMDVFNAKKFQILDESMKLLLAPISGDGK
ncbi:MAG TPA: lytic transglycosylase domain-containing protein [Chitinophagaceae bacterium]|jgi:peptidoglycan lytic transglycosylase D|nr:lytic transglycosylase domain-containing protein [Chitinophagaceae bacterium]